MSFAKMRHAFHVYLKVVRLSTFLAVVGCVASLLAARSVYGSATKSFVDLDREWSRQVGKLERDSYRVRFNGQAMRISSHMTDASIHDVLTAAEDECRAHSGGLEADIAKIPALAERLPALALGKMAGFVFGTMRHESDEAGYVACIEREGTAGVAGIGDDLRAAVESGDIGKLGTLRYVIAERGPRATKTHVLRQWTEGEFNLAKLFPAEGDVAGTDLAEVSRPDGARRILDASVEGAAVGVRVYEAPGTPASILARYDGELAAKGWKNVELPPKDAVSKRVFDQGPTDLFITASPNKYGAGTVVSIADLPPR